MSWDAGRGEYWPNASDTAPEVVKGDLFPIERTFTEWLNSAYPAGVVAPEFAGAKPDDTVAACQDCHMTRQTGAAADPQFNPVTRDCAASGCLPEHQMAGGNVWVPLLLQDPTWRLDAVNDGGNLDATAGAARSMLTRAARLSVAVTTRGTQRVVVVQVTNEAGHKLPAGYPEGRQMWLHVRAYDAQGNMVYESGRYDDATDRLVRDPDVKVYEAKQGLTADFAALLGKASGPTFHFLLNNTVIKDHRIPPRGYAQAGWDEPGLAPVGATYEDGQHWDETTYALPEGATRVRAAFYYQTASQEYIEFLRATGGVDGEALFHLRERSPSPPALMAAYPGYELWLPVIARGWSH
ncbi:MAG: hypothetical protein ACP5HG_14525 [Anaerolineae bacterium]